MADNKKELSISNALVMVGGDEELLNLLIEKFYTKYCDVGKKVVGLLKDGDFEQSRIIVHSLKGLLGNVGAEATTETAKELEAKLKACDKNHSVELKAFVESINWTMDALKKYINSF